MDFYLWSEQIEDGKDEEEYEEDNVDNEDDEGDSEEESSEESSSDESTQQQHSAAGGGVGSGTGSIGCHTRVPPTQAKTKITPLDNTATDKNAWNSAHPRLHETKSGTAVEVGLIEVVTFITACYEDARRTTTGNHSNQLNKLLTYINFISFFLLRVPTIVIEYLYTIN